MIRAAFAPMHIKNEVVMRAVIRRSDLMNGELSIWRVGNEAGQGTLDEVRAKIPTPANHTLARLLGVKAGEIREIWLRDGAGKPLGRAFSVIDDTIVDAGGNQDPSHAAIAPCQGIGIDPVAPNSVVADDLVNRLYLIFRDRQVWSAA